LKLQPSLSYLICCCERTGSTLLGNALIGTGIAGRPRSYFNRVAHFNPRIQRILGNAKDDDNYLDKVIVAATTPNGVFGAKVHWEHFLNLIAKAERSLQAYDATVSATGPERLQVRFPDLRYIWLVRKNAVARAISHYRVKKTNRWQLDSRWVADDTGGEGEPGFDFDEIEAFVRLGEAEDARWRQYFQEHDISPLDLVYEELVQDLEGAVRRVLGFLGIPAEKLNLPPPTLRKQADDRSREWEARYRRICAEEDQ
jgi:trehalose 2-sulfotransferase